MSVFTDIAIMSVFTDIITPPTLTQDQTGNA
jgi:hypothetical protein